MNQVSSLWTSFFQKSTVLSPKAVKAVSPTMLSTNLEMPHFQGNPEFRCLDPVPPQALKTFSSLEIGQKQGFPRRLKEPWFPVLTQPMRHVDF